MTPHAVVVPYPSQGHIDPLLKLAKLLHAKGFHITFVITEFNHQRLVRTRGSDAVKGLDGFRFRTIPDGLPPPSNPDATQDISLLCDSIRKTCSGPFTELVKDLNRSSDCPKATCIVADGVMSFTLKAAEELGIPEAVFFTTSACGFWGYCYYQELVDRGYVPFKDESCFSNGYLETEIDWIPGMKGIRLKDLPTFMRTTAPNDIMLTYNIEQTRDASKAKAVILNTYDELEEEVLEPIRKKLDQVYTIGPLQLLERDLPKSELNSKLRSNLWEEDNKCLEWLEQRKPNSVLYVNFGSIAVMSNKQLVEFAMGLALSKQFFLWIVRPDLVRGESAVLPEEFFEETRGRGVLGNWCQQERVLSHPSVGGFLTHCGWNSTLESIAEGVPMICWPYMAEQQTNCFYSCRRWGVGLEIEGEVRREKVEKLVRELMEGEKGMEMRKRALEWKERAERATVVGGSSYENLERLVNDTLLMN